MSDILMPWVLILITGRSISTRETHDALGQRTVNHAGHETSKCNSDATDCQGGFSLFELMAVLAILAVLLTIAVASFAHATSSTHRMTCLANQRTLNAAVQAFRADNDGVNIQTILDLEPYINNLTSATQCPADPQVSLELDPASQQITCPNHQ